MEIVRFADRSPPPVSPVPTDTVLVVGTPLSAAKAALAVIAPVPPWFNPSGDAVVSAAWAPRLVLAAALSSDLRRVSMSGFTV